MVQHLFSYGTLMQTDVQLATFGRLLKGKQDQLVGFAQSMVKIHDPDVIRISGQTHHPIVTHTGHPADRITGMVFEVSMEELLKADEYEVSDYQRISTILASGQNAWVYVDVKMVITS